MVGEKAYNAASEVAMKIRSFPIGLMILVVFSLNLPSCGNVPASPTLTPPATPTPTLAIPSQTATPTESTLSPETQTMFDKAGIKLEDLGTVKNDGLHITLESGEVVISLEDLNKNSYLGQYNVWQYRNTENTQVLYAFDKENKVLLEASKYIQLDKMNVEGYIHVDNMDELDKLVRITEMLSMPFPENTYFPEISQIDTNWDDKSNPNYSSPFGPLPKGMISPFRIANHVIVGADPGNGRPLESLCLLQHVFNSNDHTFSTIKYIRDFFGSEKDRQTLIGMMQDKSTNSPSYILPDLSIPANELGHPSVTTVRKYYGSKLIQNLVTQWIQERHVPTQLTETPVNFIFKVFR